MKNKSKHVHPKDLQRQFARSGRVGEQADAAEKSARQRGTDRARACRAGWQAPCRRRGPDAKEAVSAAASGADQEWISVFQWVTAIPNPGQ